MVGSNVIETSCHRNNRNDDDGDGENYLGPKTLKSTRIEDKNILFVFISGSSAHRKFYQDGVK
jgi:hypothetical protein